MTILSTIMGVESGGGNNLTQGNIGDINNQTGDLAQGYFQITGGTWQQFGGASTGFSSALQAPYATQLQIAQNIPIGRWGPDAQTALQNAGYSYSPNQTLGQVMSNYGETPTGTIPADGSSPFGTGSPVGGDGSNIAPSGFEPSFADPSLGTMAGNNVAPQGFAASNPGGYYDLGSAPGSYSVSGDFSQVPSPDFSSQPGATDFAPAGGVAMPAAGASAGGLFAAPSSTMPTGSTFPPTSAAGFAGTVSGDWEAVGATAVSTAGTNVGKTIAGAASALAQGNAADTSALTGAAQSIVAGALGNVTNLFVRGGILAFGLIFLAGGVLFFSRQSA